MNPKGAYRQDKWDPGVCRLDCPAEGLSREAEERWSEMEWKSYEDDDDSDDWDYGDDDEE